MVYGRVFYSMCHNPEASICIFGLTHFVGYAAVRDLIYNLLTSLAGGPAEVNCRSPSADRAWSWCVSVRLRLTANSQAQWL